MKTFYAVLVNTLFATSITNFAWFALVFWIYLQTRSVIASSVIGGSFFVFSALSGVFFGNFVDSHKKKTSLIVSTWTTAVCFGAATALLYVVGAQRIADMSLPYLWILIAMIMAGAVAASLRMITLSTLVTVVVPQEHHAQANGYVGIVNGISFAITSVFSGLAIAYIGMGYSLLLSTVITALVGLHVLMLSIAEAKPTEHTDVAPPALFDLKGALAAVRAIPGLGGLIIFSMLNNFFGGVFMALSDPYGLELVAVETWGFIWGGLSLVFILGGMAVSKFGLTDKPLRLMFRLTIITWITGMLFAVQPSIIVFVLGMIVYMLLVPAIEAAEQTVMQRVVPAEKQGRVFGFAQTAESLATPIMTFAIGPLTQLVFIPFMTTGQGVELIGAWFGTGVNRGIGLVFILSSFCGLLVTVAAMKSNAYQLLLKKFAQS